MSGPPVYQCVLGLRVTAAVLGAFGELLKGVTIAIFELIVCCFKGGTIVGFWIVSMLSQGLAIVNSWVYLCCLKGVTIVIFWIVFVLS